MMFEQTKDTLLSYSSLKGKLLELASIKCPPSNKRPSANTEGP